MGTFQTTVKAVSEAIEKNGLEHLRGSWFRNEYDEKSGEYLVVGGCVLGQAAINLGALQLEDEQYRKGTLLDALQQFSQAPGRWLVLDQDVGNVGQQIIYWNDKENEEGDFELPTYAEVAQMARECLEPYFDQEITLESYEWHIPAGVASVTGFDALF